MRSAGTLILVTATLAFLASTLIYALQPTSSAVIGPFGTVPLDPALAGQLDLAEQFLRPRVPAMSALLVLTWLSLSYHAFRRVAARPEEIEQDGGSFAEQGFLIVALVLGAFWPWLWSSRPNLSVLLCAGMLAGFLGAALRGMRLGKGFRRSGALSFAAGWATLVTCATLATLMQINLGAPAALAAGLAILVAALSSVFVQLQLGGTISYSLAVIWGMIAVAAGSVATEAAVSTMSVLAIAVIAVALVRVTT
ncbi:hypothetical protein [Paracoccus ravus]|uniref:hypothetical protein n=1 Tax=Paracoccus ravus TaxID=2447760 RepID=UPI00106E111B|nr:hypothetical protein [Paracoccus ravus]